MIFLEGSEKIDATKHIEFCVLFAKKSTCQRAKCASIIVKDGEIIGEGFNGPPANMESQRRCSFDKFKYDSKITDKTCCIHAEQRAIMDALSKNRDKIKDSKIYFARLNEEGSLEKAGPPYCTICSKMALDVGIKEFILSHKEGICAYKTDEYNSLSFNFKSTK